MIPLILQRNLMKSAFHILLFGACVLLTAPVQAQWGNPYGYGRRSAVPNTPTPQKKQEPPTAEEIVDLQMDRLTEDLGLDVFEQAVVKTIMVKYVKKRLDLQHQQLDAREVREVLDDLQQQQDNEFKTSLSPEKYEKYMSLRESNSKKKKRKKKKKKDKDKT